MKKREVKRNIENKVLKLELTNEELKQDNGDYDSYELSDEE